MMTTVLVTARIHCTTDTYVSQSTVTGLVFMFTNSVLEDG